MFTKDGYSCARSKWSEFDIGLQPWNTVQESHQEYSTGWVQMSVDKVDIGNNRIVDYTRLHAPDFSIAYPVFSDGKILLLYGYKHGVKRNVFMFPAGTIEKDETPRAAIIRELSEETGFGATTMQKMICYPITLDGNYGLSKMHLFRASGLFKESEIHNDDLENYKIVQVTKEELREIISDGMMPISAHFICALIGLNSPL